jgi:hypothetical protein
MVERKIIVDHLTISYKGLFNAAEIYKMIDFWFMEKNYTKHELVNYEQVMKTGKEVHVRMEPYKKITDYAKYVIIVEVVGSHIKEVILEKDSNKVRMNQGEISVVITGTLESDYEHRWENKAIFHFLRSLFEKYVFRTHTYKFETGLVEECNHLASQIKSFLNLYRY